MLRSSNSCIDTAIAFDTFATHRYISIEREISLVDTLQSRGLFNRLLCVWMGLTVGSG